MQSSAETSRLQQANAQLAARNQKLAELLRASREQLAQLSAQVEQLATPPSTYGTLLEWSPATHTAEVFTAQRHMRLTVAPGVAPELMHPGVQVRIGENLHIVEVTGYSHTGHLATLLELIDDERGVIADHNGEEYVVKLAASVTTAQSRQPRAGDTVLVDTKAGYIFEVIPKTEIQRLALEEVPTVSYADIGGLHAQIEQIQDAVELPFLHPDLYRTYDLHPPKGVLLYGPPGCGKTLIAKAVAHSLAQRIGFESRSYFINVKGPELLNKYVGETERRIRMIFERARELAEDGRPVIIFFDEMESIFRTRGSGVSSDMETTVVPQLLTEIDGVESLSNVIVIGATNREELIDPAILRPGRLDIKIRIERPSKYQAVDIFAKHLRDSLPTAAPAAQLIAGVVDYMYADRAYVELTLVDGSLEILHYRDFISGAMIANIVDRAKKFAIKAHLEGDASGITERRLQQAVDAEYRESEDMPNTTNPEEWSRIIGRHGLNVRHVRVIGTSTP